MIVNRKSSRVQRDSFDMNSTPQQTSLKYQRPIQDADKVTGKLLFHWFCCEGQPSLCRAQELHRKDFKCHLPRPRLEKILPGWMRWPRRQQAVPAGLLVASVAILAGPVLLAAV